MLSDTSAIKVILSKISISFFILLKSLITRNNTINDIIADINMNFFLIIIFQKSIDIT